MSRRTARAPRRGTGLLVLLGAVRRGLRERLLLSLGSIVLVALAVGSAAVGPLFSEAVTNSFLVTRLREAPPPEVGASFSYRPDDPRTPVAGATAVALDAATQVTPGLYAPARATLVTDRLDLLGGLTPLLAKEGACDHLEITGRCPTQADEVMLLAGDSQNYATAIGDTLDVAGVSFTVTGTYQLPPGGDAAYWFNVGRLSSIPARGEPNPAPAQPAPLITVPQSFDVLSAAAGVGYAVLVDRPLEVPATLTPETLAPTVAVDRRVDQSSLQVDGGTLSETGFSDLGAVLRELRAQQRTARNSIAPALLSLVLVALALLLRLLTAAADLRLPELALASLRGLPRARLWLLGLVEPLTLLALAVPVGGALGAAGGWGLVRAWLVPDLPVPRPAASLLAAGVVVLGAIGVAVLATGLVLRLDLASQLSGVRRPAASRRAGVVAQLVLVGLTLAVLVTQLAGGEPGDPDLTDLVLPVLLAAVAGLGTTRLLAAATAWWARQRPHGRSLVGYVASRAVSRRREGTLIVLPVTAAVAICVFGAGVYASASQWRASVAATATPAPVAWSSALPLDRTVALTRRLDPDGRWLMAAGTVSTPAATFAVLDTARLTRVAQWPGQWTPGTGTDEIARDLRPTGTIPVLAGRAVRLTLTADTHATVPLTVLMRLVSPNGTVHSTFVGPFDPAGTSTVTQPTPYCPDGCRWDALTVGAAAGQRIEAVGEVTLRDLQVVRRDGATPRPDALDAADWQVSGNADSPEAVAGVEAAGGSLTVTLRATSPGLAQLVSGGIPAALPVVAGVDADTGTNLGAFDATSPLAFDVDPVVTSASVPLLGPSGLLIDYDMITADREVYDQGRPVYVLARADTPTAITDGLRQAGLAIDSRYADTKRVLDESAYALALRLYAVVAALVLLMALAALAVSTAVQLPVRRRDAASLRVVGVPRRTVMAAVVAELGAVLGATALAGLAAGTLAQYVVLRTVRLGYVEDLATPALVADIDPLRVAVAAGAAAVVLGAVAVVSALLSVRGARGSTLRESAR